MMEKKPDYKKKIEHYLSFLDLFLGKYSESIEDSYIT